MSDKAEWLARLNVGDPVVVRTWPYDKRHVRKALRFTKTLIVTDDGWRFRRRDGNLPGDDPWRMYWIEKPTAAEARKVRKAKR